MTTLVYNRLRIACAALLLVRAVVAQTCYYANGDEAKAEKPCSSAQGSACCPDKWACLDNGLCYYEPDNLYGRYSCTDKSWKADGCPSNLCTYDMKAAGAEAITQCPNHSNQWCCDGDRTHVDCCNENPKRPFFSLGDGKQYAIVGSSTANSVPNLATITGLVSGGDSSPSSTSPPSSSSDPSSASKDSPQSSSTVSTPAPTLTPTTLTSTSISSGADGVKTFTTTQISTFTPPPAASSTSDPSPSSSSSSSKIPIIVGCAVGIPIGLAFLAILTWLLRKRFRQSKNPYDPPDGANPNDVPEFAGGAKFKHHNAQHPPTYTPSPDVPELASQSIGPERPVSLLPGKAELGGGAGFAPGTMAPAPHLVGVGGGSGNGSPRTGNSWGSSPPGYSPGQNHAAWADHAYQQPAVAMPDAREYVPYRMPQGHAGGMPEMAELPVHTPPAVEMGAGRSPPAVAELRSDASPPAVGDMGQQRVPPQ